MKTSRYISDSLRQFVTERAINHCEYCFIPYLKPMFRFHIEHIIALKHSGETVIENLALACPVCNEHKGSDLGSLDWDLDEKFAFFFNPRRQTWTEHFHLEESGEIIPLTAEARVTARILKFNDAERIEERRDLIEAGIY